MAMSCLSQFRVLHVPACVSTHVCVCPAACGADINRVHTKTGASALTRAAAARLPDTVAACIEAGADCEWATDAGNDALAEAEAALEHARRDVSAWDTRGESDSDHDDNGGDDGGDDGADVDAGGDDAVAVDESASSAGGADDETAAPAQPSASGDGDGDSKGAEGDSSGEGDCKGEDEGEGDDNGDGAAAPPASDTDAATSIASSHSGHEDNHTDDDAASMDRVDRMALVLAQHHLEQAQATLALLTAFARAVDAGRWDEVKQCVTTARLYCTYL